MKDHTPVTELSDFLRITRQIREATREDFILGAQSMGYFLEDNGSAHELARQLTNLVEIETRERMRERYTLPEPRWR